MRFLERIEAARLGKSTPVKLAQRALAGSLLVASVFVLFPAWQALLSLWKPAPHQHLGLRHGLALSAFLLPLAIGEAVNRLALWDLSAGLAKDVWTESQLESTRKWIESDRQEKIAWWYSSITFWISIAVILLWGVAAHWKLSIDGNVKLMVLLTLWLRVPLNTRAKLRAKLCPPPPARVPPKGWTGTISGLYSEHWGGRKPANAVSEAAQS